MPLKIIQVGVGGMGAFWVNVVYGSSDWEAAAYVDINEEMLQKAAAKCDMPEDRCYTDLDKALREVKADALLDITPPMFRAEVCLKAFKAGLPVLSEKPLADTMENALKIVEEADKRNLPYAVAQNYRFNPRPRTIRKLLDEKKFGDLGYAGVVFQKGPKFPGSFRLTMDYPLVIDMSIHHFDLMRYMFNADPVTIYAKSWKPDWSWFEKDPSAAIIIEMTNGMIVHYFGSWVAQGNETPWNGDWRIQCSQGGIYWLDDKVYSSSDPMSKTEEKLVDMELIGQAYILDEFAKVLREGKTPETEGKDNLNSLAMVFSAVDSIKKGKMVEVKV